MNKLTNPQFNALTNEVIRLGKQIATIENFSANVSFNKNYISFTIHNGNIRNCCIIYFHIERYMSMRETNEFLDFTKGLQLNYGKYLTMIMDAHKDADKSELYFDF